MHLCEPNRGQKKTERREKEGDRLTGAGGKSSANENDKVAVGEEKRHLRDGVGDDGAGSKICGRDNFFATPTSCRKRLGTRHAPEMALRKKLIVRVGHSVRPDLSASSPHLRLLRDHS